MLLLLQQQFFILLKYVQLQVYQPLQLGVQLLLQQQFSLPQDALLQVSRLQELIVQPIQQQLFILRLFYQLHIVPLKRLAPQLLPFRFPLRQVFLILGGLLLIKQPLRQQYVPAQFFRFQLLQLQAFHFLFFRLPLGLLALLILELQQQGALVQDDLPPLERPLQRRCEQPLLRLRFSLIQYAQLLGVKLRPKPLLRQYELLQLPQMQFFLILR